MSRSALDVDPRDDHPGRVWSRLSRQQKYYVVELYGTPHIVIEPRTVASMLRKGLITRGPEEHHYPLTPLGEAVAFYRLSLNTEGLHFPECDRVRDAEALCHPDCPVFRYLRVSGQQEGQA